MSDRGPIRRPGSSRTSVWSMPSSATRDDGLALAASGLELAAGGRIGITGASGAGKSSLLHALTGIERPTAGRIVWDGIDVAALPEAARDAWRRRHVGLVFQDFHLMPGLSILGNVLLPVYFEHLRAPACAVASARSVL